MRSLFNLVGTLICLTQRLPTADVVQATVSQKQNRIAGVARIEYCLRGSNLDLKIERRRGFFFMMGESTLRSEKGGLESTFFCEAIRRLNTIDVTKGEQAIPIENPVKSEAVFSLVEYFL